MAEPTVQDGRSFNDALCKNMVITGVVGVTEPHMITNIYNNQPMAMDLNWKNDYQMDSPGTDWYLNRTYYK